MRVLVAGATGHLGRPVVRRLVAAGHEVAGTTRTPGKRRLLEELGAHPILMDALQPSQVHDAFRGWRPDAVIHALTALPSTTGPLRHRDLVATNRLRRTGTRNVLDACRRSGVERIVAESMVFAYGYGDHGPESLNEDDPLPDIAHDSPTWDHVDAVRQLERQVVRTRDGIHGIALRYGLFYGPGGGWHRLARLLRWRLLPLPGGGGSLLPWIQIDDAAAATVAALEQGRSGEVYNVVDDQPARFRDLVSRFADELDLPRPWSLPVPLSRRLIPHATRSLASTRLLLSNQKAKQQLEWSPRFPCYRDGIRDLARQITSSRTEDRP